MTDIPAQVGEQPRENLSRGYGFFCIIFVFVGQLFMLQLFVSVIIDSFNFAEGSGLLTGEQALYADMLKLTNMLTPEPKPTPMGGDDEEDVEYTQTREEKKKNDDLGITPRLIPPEPSGLRFEAYNCFMNCDPLPVKVIRTPF
jgi:hypothetical protein